MKRTTIVAMTVATLLSAAGCGQQGGTSPKAGPPTADKVGSCATSSSSVLHALPVYQAIDLDHDGGGETLSVTRPDSTCPNVMFAQVHGDFASLDLKGVQLDLKTARRVIVPGRDSDLMAIREVHPRGGFQVHLYGYADGRLAEVTTPEGDRVVPFVATDTRGGYVSASCTDGGLVVRQAVAHKPPGVVFAWDVEQVSYQLDGTTATPGKKREVKDNVLDARLAKDYPELVGREMFTSGCGS
jgi:predicted small lipoprotein YifL